MVRAVRGPEADMPKSMLPKEVDKTLRKLGSDGDKVRGTIEREFADYLEAKAQERRSRDLGRDGVGPGRVGPGPGHQAGRPPAGRGAVQPEDVRVRVVRSRPPRRRGRAGTSMTGAGMARRPGRRPGPAAAPASGDAGKSPKAQALRATGGRPAS